MKSMITVSVSILYTLILRVMHEYKSGLQPEANIENGRGYQ